MQQNDEENLYDAPYIQKILNHRKEKKCETLSNSIKFL